MVAVDQVGIGGFNTINSGNTDTAFDYTKIPGVGNYLKKSDENFIRTFEKKEETGIENADWEKEKYKRLKNKYGDEFSSSIGTGTQIVDASQNKIYSDMNAPSLGAKDGSLIAMANTDNKGIVTAAPETKVSETRMAGEGFFSPKNFQRSGVPDATIMTREQYAKSLPGADKEYSRFGGLLDPGTRGGEEIRRYNEAYKRDFFSPREADSRSIAERQEASQQSIRDEARIRNEQFQANRGKPVRDTRPSADDTYGTNVMSNPAFGFRSKMSDENKARYDASATEATRRSQVEPNLGAAVQSTVNIGKRLLNTAIGASEGTAFTREVPLVTRGQAEEKRATEYLRRPSYQKAASARLAGGITLDQVRADQQKKITDDARARTERFQAQKKEAAANKASDRRAAEVERVARRTPENTGTGRDGTFGAGTVGQGMPSNPDFRGPGNNKAYAPRQTVAALPSDYKQTEAREFAKAAAFKEQQKAKEAAVNRASREGAASTGIPSGSNLKAGSFGISEAGRKQAAQNRQAAQKKSAPSTQKSAPSTQKSAPSPSSNKRADAAKKRRAAQSKAAAAKKTSPKTTQKKSTAKKSSPSSQASNKRAQASKKRQAAKKKASAAKKKSAPKKKKAAPKKKKSISRPRGRTRRGGRRCDIRCKYDIMPLTNMNLIMDDLAEVAYFVKEIQK